MMPHWLISAFNKNIIKRAEGGRGTTETEKEGTE
jgi:hypothetical protein